MPLATSTAPHPPFGHLLPALPSNHRRGEGQQRLAQRDAGSPSPRDARGERVAKGRVRGRGSHKEPPLIRPSGTFSPPAHPTHRRGEGQPSRALEFGHLLKLELRSYDLPGAQDVDRTGWGDSKSIREVCLRGLAPLHGAWRAKARETTEPRAGTRVLRRWRGLLGWPRKRQLKLPQSKVLRTGGSLDCGHFSCRFCGQLDGPSPGQQARRRRPGK